MIKTAFLVAGIMLAAYPMSSKAQTNVSIIGNGSGSSSSVTVNNSSNTSTITQQSTANTQTHITIESNGQVKTYDSNQPGTVHIQSDDGHAQVTVNNNSTGTNTSSTNTSTYPKNSQNLQNSGANNSEVNPVDNELNATLTPSPTPKINQHTIVKAQATTNILTGILNDLENLSKQIIKIL